MRTLLLTSTCLLVFSVSTWPAFCYETRQAVSDATWNLLGVRLEPASGPHSIYRGGMRVVKIGPGPASKGGVEVGDVLVGIDRWETVSHENVVWLLKHLRETRPNSVRFYVVRNQQPLYGDFNLDFSAAK